jgi:hypothetical protein
MRMKFAVTSRSEIGDLIQRKQLVLLIHLAASIFLAVKFKSMRSLIAPKK